MNLATKEAVLAVAHNRRNGISAEKGPEYAGSAGKYADADQDVLANFKRQGMRWGTNPLLPMGVYFGKHIDSIETFVREVTRDGVTPDQQRTLAAAGEGIVSRIDDARNYLDLMECLLIDLSIVEQPPNPADEIDWDAMDQADWGVVDVCRTDGTLVDKCVCEPEDSVTDISVTAHVGDVTGEDIEQAVRDGEAQYVADDYNYLRNRVLDLTEDQPW